MFTPMTVWVGTASLMVCVVLFRFVHSIARHFKCGHRWIGMGKEREELWIPGDRPLSSSDDYYDEFDD